jgi:predicted RNA binding protein YcfA (HicA-like mRNA interferase family)
MPKLPGVNHLEAIRAFEKAGFVIERQGKHVTMRKAGHPRPITIPRNNPINSFTMGGLIRDSGLTLEEFKRLL